jgi:predicted MFS family arabinose efflux permease
MTPTAGGAKSSWIAVLCVAAGAFAMVTAEFLPIGLLSHIAEAFGVPAGRGGLLVTMPGIVAAITAPICPIMARRLDRSHLLIGFTIVILMSNLIVADAATFGVALFGRALLGISVGGFWTFAAAVGRRLVGEQNGNRATSIIVAGISSATVVGVPIGSALGSFAGWRFAFVAEAVLCLLVLLAQVICLPRVLATTTPTFQTILEVARSRKLAIAFTAAAMAAAGHFAAYTYFEPHLDENLCLSATELGVVLAIYGVAGIAGTFLGERLASRNPEAGFFVVAVMMAISIFMTFQLSSSLVAEGLAVALWGLSFGAVPVCVQIWVYAADPVRFETSSALMVSVFQTALAAGSFSGGLLADRFGLCAAFWAGALLNLLCAVLIGGVLLRASHCHIKEI